VCFVCFILLYQSSLWLLHFNKLLLLHLWGIFYGFCKTRHILLSDSANCTVLRAVVLTQCRRVTDRQTDGRTNGIAVGNTALAMRAIACNASIAARCNKVIGTLMIKEICWCWLPSWLDRQRETLSVYRNRPVRRHNQRHISLIINVLSLTILNLSSDSNTNKNKVGPIGSIFIFSALATDQFCTCAYCTKPYHFQI